MDIFKDFSDSFKARLHDYNTSPFLSSLLFSWLLINHKYVLLYFSSEDIYIKMDLLLEYQTTHQYSFYLYPMLFSLFYIFIYPYIHYYFYTFTARQIIKLQNEKNKLKKQKLLLLNKSTS